MKLLSVATAASVIIGDSLFWSGTIWGGGHPSPLAQQLEMYARHTIENHALVGAALEEGWIKSIPSQFHDIPDGADIGTLIMDGGGNDIMIHRDDCRTLTPRCIAQIDRCADIAENLLQQAHKMTTHILYLGFYYLPEFEAKVVDYANEKFAGLCNDACVFVDPRQNITADMIGNDGVHPTTQGYHILADLLWDAACSRGIVL